MKALIPAARDPRMRPFAQQLNKHLIPLGNKPMLFYVLDKLSEAGILEIGIVVSENDPSIQEAVGDGSRWHVEITYIPQAGGAKGIAHALMLARDFLGDDPFALHLGDNLVQDDLGPIFERFLTDHPTSLLAFARVKQPQRFGVPVLDGRRILRVEERPFHPKSPYAVCGLYLYGPEVHDVLSLLRPSSRGDYEISDVHSALIERGNTVQWVELLGWWKDTGRPEDLLEGNRFVLQGRTDSAIAGDVMPSVDMAGPVEIGRGTRILGRSILRGPAVIGEGCLIQDAYIGPFTSIGDRVEIHGGEIENSMLFDDVRIASPKRIQGSILGRGAIIAKEQDTKPSGHRLFIGEGAVVDL